MIFPCDHSSRSRLAGVLAPLRKRSPSRPECSGTDLGSFPMGRRIGLLACAFFCAALPLAAQSTGDLIARGDALDKQHKNREALGVYLQAAATGPENAGVLRRLAGQYSQLMDDSADATQRKEFADKALSCATKAKELAPKDAKVRLALAIVYGRIALLESPRKQLDMSRLIREELEASLALDPNDPLAWYVLGRWNYEVANKSPLLKGLARTVYGEFPDGSNDRAVACFEKAVALDPSRPANHIELGRALAALGKKTEALGLINKGLAIPSSEKDDAAAKARGLKTLRTL